jgi:rhodanese-related sulfurtransferase
VLSFIRRLMAGPPSIDVAELEALLADGSIQVLDVREDHEFRRGHVPGAVHIPAGRLPERAGRLARDRRYAVICESGNRSRGPTRYLLEQGFEGTVSVRGGTGAWARGGRPLTR